MKLTSTMLNCLRQWAEDMEWTPRGSPKQIRRALIRRGLMERWQSGKYTGFKVTALGKQIVAQGNFKIGTIALGVQSEPDENEIPKYRRKDPVPKVERTDHEYRRLRALATRDKQAKETKQQRRQVKK